MARHPHPLHDHPHLARLRELADTLDAARAQVLDLLALPPNELPAHEDASDLLADLQGLRWALGIGVNLIAGILPPAK